MLFHSCGARCSRVGDVGAAVGEGNHGIGHGWLFPQEQRRAANSGQFAHVVNARLRDPVAIARPDRLLLGRSEHQSVCKCRRPNRKFDWHVRILISEFRSWRFASCPCCATK